MSLRQHDTLIKADYGLSNVPFDYLPLADGHALHENDGKPIFIDHVLLVLKDVDD